jgi:hypothetical protein
MRFTSTHARHSLALASLALCGIALSSNARVAQDPAKPATPSAADVEFFERDIRPLLIQRCYECHSSQAKRLKGKLHLDSQQGWLTGGESGPALVPGDVEASTLIRAVRYAGEITMPPAGKLDAREIALLEEWVRRGAPSGSDNAPAPSAANAVPFEERSKAALATHWAFQRMSNSPPPQVADARWPRNDIDRFVLARLEAQGLHPAPEADRRTLLRRLSYDLTGLPPSREDVETFESDTSPDAYEKRVDQLLASPHYGERWGRYWLDLARYSDSNGLDENLSMSNAWRYRDWVVRALDDDMPYDRFLTLQLAGDLLPEPADDAQLRDQLTATGFLVLGPKMLAEQDKEKLVMDVVDEQMDVASRTFLGLTVGCARCHDHKFDPIPTRDYYALAGVFKSTATLANTAFVSRWNERTLARADAIEARRVREEARNAAKKKLGELRDAADARFLSAWRGDVASYLLAANFAGRDVLLLEAEEASRGNLIADKDHFGSADVVVARTGNDGQQFAEYDMTFANATRRQLEVRMASEESRPVRVLLNGVVAFESALGQTTGSWNPDTQTWIRVGELSLTAGRNVLRIERDGSTPHLDKLLLVPLAAGEATSDWPNQDNPWSGNLVSEVMRNWVCYLETAERKHDNVFGIWREFAALDEAEFAAKSSELTLALQKRVASKELTPNSQVLALLDGLPVTSMRELAGRYQTLFSTVDRQWRDRKPNADGKLPDALADASAEEVRQVLYGSGSPLSLARHSLEALYPQATRAEVAAADAALHECERALPPAFDTALGVRDAEAIADMPVCVRGNHLDKSGPAIPRGFLGLSDAFVAQPSIGEHESGRLQLAHWMLDPEHPLTSRVIVNRLWQGHFGRGLVASSSNFGLRGDAPTHPELLDWLARELQRRGWSLKAMHRLICTSSTYRMSCSNDAVAAERDPENRLLWRANRRRLEAESIRDSLLAAGGRLDLALGGNLLDTPNGDYATNDQSNNKARYDVTRRTLYLPVIRNAMLDLFSAFDYADPSMTIEQRSSTTSAPQALYLMNSPLVIESSRELAKRVLAEQTENASRVDALYAHVLAREPNTSERERALAFVARLVEPVLELQSANTAGGVHAPSQEMQDATVNAWRALGQVLLVSNEALYVE